MNPIIKSLSIPLLALAFALAAGTGCETSMGEMKSPSVAKVEIADGTNKVSVRVVASRFNKQTQVGVRHLQVEGWKEAIEEFNKAVTASPNDVGSLLGLAVAYEQLGQYDKAAEHYRKANAAKSGGEPDPAVLAGIKRAERKLKTGR